MTNTQPLTEQDDSPAAPGRPVRLVPTPSGFWFVAGGIVVALLAPLFGILIGSSMGAEDPKARMVPLYWGFFIGSAIGALGLLSAAIGALRLFRGARGAGDPEVGVHEKDLHEEDLHEVDVHETDGREEEVGR